MFKLLPVSEFSVNADFINNVITDPETYGTFANLLKCYYFIADEIYDFARTKPLVQYDENKKFYYFYDFVQKRSESIRRNRYKPTKMQNAIFDKNGINRNFKKQHGLIVQRKPGMHKEDIKQLKQEFIEYSYAYNQDINFYRKRKIDLPEEWAEHLYKVFRELSDKATFFYKQRGSFILAQEMVSILSNQSIFLYCKNLIRLGNDREKIIRQIKQSKQFMFGEIKHKRSKSH